MDKTTPMKSKPLVDVTCKLGTKGCFEDGRCHALGNCENKITTNADRIRAMSDEELADFFFESPEIEFTVCEYCEYFGGHTSDTPCKHDMGRCLVPSKNEAFKKWLKQPAEGE